MGPFLFEWVNFIPTGEWNFADFSNFLTSSTNKIVHTLSRPWTIWDFFFHKPWENGKFGSWWCLVLGDKVFALFIYWILVTIWTRTRNLSDPLITMILKLLPEWEFQLFISECWIISIWCRSSVRIDLKYTVCFYILRINVMFTSLP